MDQISNYLKSIVEDIPKYELTSEDHTLIRLEGINSFILKKINSSEYKASSITPDYLTKVKDKIALCVNHEAPIHFTVPFGAVKVSTLPTAPGIDWGEIFAISLIREYLTPIAKAYKHGVLVDFVSVSVFEEKMNYFSQQDIDLYDREFKKIIDIFQKFLPNGFKLRYRKLTDELPKNHMLKMVDKKVKELEKNWPKNSDEIKRNKIMRAQRNCNLNLNDKDYDKKILQSIFVHDAFCSECWTMDAAPWDKKDMITLGYRYTDGWAVHIRSARGSTVNFWSGIGALQKKGSKIISTVLSYKQYKSFGEKIVMEKVGYFDDEFKNLNSIPVLSFV